MFVLIDCLFFYVLEDEFAPDQSPVLLLIIIEKLGNVNIF